MCSRSASTPSCGLLSHWPGCACRADVVRGDARALPLDNDSVDLIVTSPPYAANAIDYMRANKFSLMWLGHEPGRLTRLRREYIGAEIQETDLSFPSETAARVLTSLRDLDHRRAAVVAYYYRDLQAILGEMLRVLRVGRAAVLVVGTSTICGIDIQAPAVLAELAAAVGFHVVGVATRSIARNARLMPISQTSSRGGIEARMHEEGVIGLIKRG